EPSPAPTSRTRSPGPTPASSAIRRARAGSTRKFCPSDFRGRTPWVAAIERMAVGVSEDAVEVRASPPDVDRDDALVERGELGERRLAEVDDPTARARGATVVDYHSDRPPVRPVGHRRQRALGQPGTRPAHPAPWIPGGAAARGPSRRSWSGRVWNLYRTSGNARWAFALVRATISSRSSPRTSARTAMVSTTLAG